MAWGHCPLPQWGHKGVSLVWGHVGDAVQHPDRMWGCSCLGDMLRDTVPCLSGHIGVSLAWGHVGDTVSDPTGVQGCSWLGDVAGDALWHPSQGRRDAFGLGTCSGTSSGTLSPALAGIWGCSWLGDALGALFGTLLSALAGTWEYFGAWGHCPLPQRGHRAALGLGTRLGHSGGHCSVP